MKKLTRQFSDTVAYSSADRTAVSVRDGVLEYLGIELDLEPKDKVFTVYRSPATIANAAQGMPGIPLTNEHVSLDVPAVDTGSVVTSSTVIDQIDEATSSRLAVKNKLNVSEGMSVALSDKRELSLGYNAQLVPHSKWDFEQVNIVPHHLAAVEAGRCGPLCSFLDRKIRTEDCMTTLHKAFTDAEGVESLEMIAEIAMGLPEAIKKVPIDQLKKLMPAMKQIMSHAQESGVMPEQVEASDEEETDAESEDIVSEDTSEELDMKDEEKPEEEKKFSDADVKKFVEKQSQKFADAEVKLYASVVNKAKNFLDSEFDYSDKTSRDIMRAALATQSTDSFEDSELSVAFKLLRKQEANYSQFGDAKAEDSLVARINKTLEA